MDIVIKDKGTPYERVYYKYSVLVDSILIECEAGTNQDIPEWVDDMLVETFNNFKTPIGVVLSNDMYHLYCAVRSLQVGSKNLIRYKEHLGVLGPVKIYHGGVRCGTDFLHKPRLSYSKESIVILQETL